MKPNTYSLNYARDLTINCSIENDKDTKYNFNLEKIEVPYENQQHFFICSKSFKALKAAYICRQANKQSKII